MKKRRKEDRGGAGKRDRRGKIRYTSPDSAYPHDELTSLLRPSPNAEQPTDFRIFRREKPPKVQTMPLRERGEPRDSKKSINVILFGRVGGFFRRKPAYTP